MRKKDFELIASMLAEARNGEVARLYAAKRHISAVVVERLRRRAAEIERIAQAWADWLAATDPNFDR